ncbi:MAG: hypothetical protein J5529_03050 [Prevotella sp.]|nr:hypothetical protein [Prevotella sp.]
MIIENGTIVPRLPSECRIDPETGHPVKLRPEWGEPIPCQYAPSKMDLAGRVGGERAAQVSFTVLMEQPPCCDRARLCDRCGCDIGEFPLISVERLEAVGQWRVLL